jgi:hypothetical protein
MGRIIGFCFGLLHRFAKVTKRRIGLTVFSGVSAVIRRDSQGRQRPSRARPDHDGSVGSVRQRFASSTGERRTCAD